MANPRARLDFMIFIHDFIYLLQATGDALNIENEVMFSVIFANS